jgi:tRNA-splicing ligase RtcB
LGVVFRNYVVDWLIRGSQMNKRELKNLGIPAGELLRTARDVVVEARNLGLKPSAIRKIVRDLVSDPASYNDDPVFGRLAKGLLATAEARSSYKPRTDSAPYRKWGHDLEPESIQQLENACKLPISVRGALMPDAHRGYGLPIGGVLATRNAVIPYAVGVDIACRMKMTVLDLPTSSIDETPDKLIRAIDKETRFGIGASFKRRREHEVMDESWAVSPVTRELKDKAWSQLGSSGSGNHFVEFGLLDVEGDELEIPPGRYLALLSHSGSRGAGNTVASHFSKVAMKRHPELPKELMHLAWLDLDSDAGQEYWKAMQLMGRYAAANHACIHRHLREHLGAHVLLDLENHHNFAWQEEHDGETVIVHRKGATPASEGTLGIIPGSMATPTYIVRGKGNRDSLNSASHGAGRVMSRKQAKKTFQWHKVNKLLEERRVRLLSAGLDEAPMVYKDIDEVMNAQRDLVDRLARFQPRIVKMAPAGERPED